MTRTRWRHGLAIAGFVLLVAGAAVAQFGGPRGRFALRRNIGYDGRFTFVRLNYTTAPGGYWYRGEPAWAHGYPLAEQNLMSIMNEVSDLGAHVEEINSLTLDDPELFKYPIAYVIEPDWWAMTDAEAAGLRDYLQKGGFLIVDDFKGRAFRGGGGWETFERNMKRALPEARFVDLDISHPIFHSFFESSRCMFWQAYVPAATRFFAAVRGQRSGQAAADHRELQHRHLAVLGVVGAHWQGRLKHGKVSHKLGVNLHHLRNDTLNSRVVNCSWVIGDSNSPSRIHQLTNCENRI